MTETSETLTLWRISVYPTLEGRGGLHAKGRWNLKGHPIVYLSESPSASMLEVLAHLPDTPSEIPTEYCLLRVQAAAATKYLPLNPPDKIRWQDDLESTARIGHKWLTTAQTALARVPSAIVPFTWNYLLNPLHPDAENVTIAGVTNHLYDPRLLRVRKTSSRRTQ